ncbi:MAG: phage portal protein [Angelakisella sp.]|nr:phage portal protein [Angelakisella sp.]
MDANFRQIELLINQLYTISEMGSAIFGDLSNKTGEVPSGSALRRLMMSPLAKARRIANKFDGPLKALVSACAAIRGENIPPEDISIKWNDGLPDDEVENANIMSVRTGGKATISQHTAIQRLDGMGDKDAAAELDEIRADEAEKDMGTPPAEEVPQDEEEPLEDNNE